MQLYNAFEKIAVGLKWTSVHVTHQHDLCKLILIDVSANEGADMVI